MDYGRKYWLSDRNPGARVKKGKKQGAFAGWEQVQRADRATGGHLRRHLDKFEERYEVVDPVYARNEKGKLVEVRTLHAS